MPNPTSQEPDIRPEPGATPPESLRSSLETAWDAHSKPEAPAPAPEPAPAAKAPRSRDAAGRFTGEIPAFSDQKPPEPEPKAQEPAQTAQEAAPAPAEGSDGSDKVPASWKPEKADLWKGIPADAKGYIHEREAELARGFEQTAKVRQVAESILAEFTPYQEILQAENATPITAIRALLQTAYALRSSEPEYRKLLFLQLAQQYGVDLTTGINPELAKAQGEASRLGMQQMESAARGQLDQQRQIEGELAAFANTHEFFPQVREVMGRLLHSGVAADLESAYNQAVKLSPEVQKTLEERGVEAAERAKQDADRARAAKLGLGGGAGVSGPTRTPQEQRVANAKSVREALEAAWDAHAGGR